MAVLSSHVSQPVCAEWPHLKWRTSVNISLCMTWNSGDPQIQWSLVVTHHFDSEVEVKDLTLFLNQVKRKIATTRVKQFAHQSITSSPDATDVWNFEYIFWVLFLLPFSIFVPHISWWAFLKINTVPVGLLFWPGTQLLTWCRIKTYLF